MEAVRFGGAGEIEIDDAGLDDGALINGIEIEDAIHAGEDEYDAAASSECAAGEAGAGAAADDGSFVLGGEFCDLRNVGGGGGKDDEFRAGFFDGAVVLVEHEIFGEREDTRRTEELFEFADQRRVHGTGESITPIGRFILPSPRDGEELAFSGVAREVGW